ncbi:MAG: hypothetical protein ACJ72H_05745 [Candidatus Sulfotelmatobacter sp.]
MFIRKRKVKGHEYFALVESVRVEGKPRQRLIYNMGKRKTLEECIRAETKRLEYRIGLLDKTRPSPVYFRIVVELHFALRQKRKLLRNIESESSS